MNANIPNKVRRSVYARDGYRCALCDCSQHLQVHHVIPRGQGGSYSAHNLVTLCSTCHAQAHGIGLVEDMTQEEMNQLCVEYLADLYAPRWDPWKD